MVEQDLFNCQRHGSGVSGSNGGREPGQSVDSATASVYTACKSASRLRALTLSTGLMWLWRTASDRVAIVWS